jgi:hypothetical protein
MMRALLAALPLVVAGCAAAPAPVTPVVPVRAAQPPINYAPAGPVALRNPSFEMEPGAGARCAARWSCTMHADPKSFRFFADASQSTDGKRSFCVEPVTKEPWAIVGQGILDKSLNGARVRFTLSVKLDKVGGQGAGPWAQVQRAGVAARPTFQKLAKDSHGWEDQSVEFDVPADATSVEVGATLRGTGRACFDNARLEVLRSGKNPV